jgi:hypothetical protein
MHERQAIWRIGIDGGYHLIHGFVRPLHHHIIGQPDVVRNVYGLHQHRLSRRFDAAFAAGPSALPTISESNEK